MTSRRSILTAAVATSFASALASGRATAQNSRLNIKLEEPRRGLAGKDVMWLGSQEAIVVRMLQMAAVTARDYVVDLGSGDGRIPIIAAKTIGVRALGLEYNPDLVTLSRRNAERAGVQAKVKFERADIFETDFSTATVVTMYLLPELDLRLRPILFKMKPGTRIVSNSFDMQTWKPDEESIVGHEHSFLWIIPADLSGSWKMNYRGPAALDVPESLTVRQRFQRIQGEGNFGENDASLQDTHLRGNTVSFSLRNAKGEVLNFSGLVNGNRMSGTVRGVRLRPTRFDALRTPDGPPFPEAVGTQAEQIEAVRALGAQ